MVKRFCLGCEDEAKETHMFKGIFFDNDENDWVEEVYCNNCLANILTEEPEIISDLEAI